MNQLTVRIKEKNQTYPIFIGIDILKSIETYIDMSSYGKIFILTDKQVEKALLKNMPQFLSKETVTIILPFGERAKTIETVEEIWKELLMSSCDRSSLIINIGGGVICDVGGFAASTFMRGIDFIDVPTTLLSQVDASVGGKTGVNFCEVKNLIGSFQQPKAVVIDVALLATLSERIFKEGFAEIIKHGLISDKKYFDQVTSKKPKDFTREELVEIIRKSCRIKTQIIEKDIEEKKERRLLNFGHTLGHAIEAACLTTNSPLLHGEAVAIGIIGESYISFLKKMISEKEFQRIINGITFSGLPMSVTGITKESILEKLHHDKKQNKGEIQWTLISGIGEAVINQPVSQDVIEKAIEKVMGK